METIMVCVDIEFLAKGILTLNKRYLIEDHISNSEGNRYVITKDDGVKGEFRIDRFITIEEFRIRKLKKLGI
jgi:hypothetical protein